MDKSPRRRPSTRISVWFVPRPRRLMLDRVLPGPLLVKPDVRCASLPFALFVVTRVRKKSSSVVACEAWMSFWSNTR